MTAHKIRDIKLAPKGVLNIAWAEQDMQALLKVRQEFARTRPFRGVRVGMALHITKETAVLVRTLITGGAEVAICSCNPLSTQDDVAAALACDGVRVYGYKGESKAEYYEYLNDVIEFKPQITIDDGCDLVSEIHGKYPRLIPDIIGGCEETTTGVIRLRAMAKDGALKYPIIAVNDNKTKHLMDNYYGTGQSTIDGLLRAANILFAGKTVVVAGYGSCGKGVAMRAAGLGSQVIVTEVDAFCALQARMDGFQVMPMRDAAPLGDIFVTVTGNKAVIPGPVIARMKDGAILANAGHFDNEIDMPALRKAVRKVTRVRDSIFDRYELRNGKSVYLAGEGRLVNLACAEGHPSMVMSLSFCGQALAALHLIRNRGRLLPGVITLPAAIDDRIAALQLEAMGIRIDTLTAAQRRYLDSWSEGT
ncbi:MAG: adenosylhomocysteinase [Planctomycetota bacterium]